MLKTSIHLFSNYRLDLKIIKRRKHSRVLPLFPSLDKIRKVRSGNKLSRYFRHVFEHSRIKKIFGANLAVAIIATSFFPVIDNSLFGESEDVVIESQLVLATQIAIAFPLKEIKVTQGYSFFHPGIDFDGVTGDLVYPIMPGTVYAIDYSRTAYGNAVLLNHGNNLTSLYAHLSKINVKVGESVNTGFSIGEVGATGRASGDHLHLEVRDHGYQTNPYLVLPN